MPRRPAAITQADVARAIRAARQAGAETVEVKPNGSILIHLSPQSPLSPANGEAQVAEQQDFVL